MSSKARSLRRSSNRSACSMVALDQEIFHILNALAAYGPVADGVIIFCATYLPFLVVFAYAVYLLRTRNTAWMALIEFVLALLAGLLARWMTSLIRLALPRARPFVDLGTQQLLDIAAHVPSFPSGHASFFFGLSTYAFLQNRKIGLVLYAVSVVICFARVAAGVHYPSDIAAGAVVGLIAGYGVHRFISPFLQRK